MENKYLGQILARLRPGFDGQVLAHKNYKVVWNDSRPQPTQVEMEAEYQKILKEEQDENQRKSDKEQMKSELKAMDFSKPLKPQELQDALKKALKVIDVI